MFSVQLKASFDEENVQSEQMTQAIGIFNTLDANNKYTELFTLSDLNKLPMGIKRQFGNNEYTVALSGYQHNGDYAELTIFGRITTPQQVLFFGAQGIKFSYGGDFTGDVKLMLLADMTMPLWGGAELILHGGFDKESGRGVEKTYLTMGCESVVF
jgi:hypothetical protein